MLHSSSKFCANSAASSGAPSAVTTTFSWSVHESVVQFIDPVQTDSASRTTYLWCIRSGMPGIPQVGNGIASSSSGFVRGGGGKMSRSGMVRVVSDPHAHAALGRLTQRAGHHVARLARQPHVVEREVERLARLAEERGDAARHLHRVAAGMERERLDHCCQRKPAGAMRGSSGLVRSPSGSSGWL